MKKYVFGVFAIALALGFSSYTSHPKKFASTWYTYNGAQTQPERVKAANYSKISADPLCNATTNECAVEMSSDQGAHPNFTGVTFDANGYPQPDVTHVVANELLN